MRNPLVVRLVRVKHVVLVWNASREHSICFVIVSVTLEYWEEGTTFHTRTTQIKDGTATTTVVARLVHI